MRSKLIFALAIGITSAACATTATGCVAHGHAHVGAAPVTFHHPPTLVAIAPGVWVVRDHDAVVYYADGSYWHYASGTWYRADGWDSDEWVTVQVALVPASIATRDHDLYVHYSGDANAQTRSAPPAHAAAQHGGPPGHDSPPGLGNQRRDHMPPGQAKKDDDEHPAERPGDGPEADPPGKEPGPPPGLGPDGAKGEGPKGKGPKGKPDHAGGPGH